MSVRWGITAVCAGLATRDVPATADRPSAWKGQRFREALPVPCGAAHEVGGWWRREHIRNVQKQVNLQKIFPVITQGVKFLREAVFSCQKQT